MDEVKITAANPEDLRAVAESLMRQVESLMGQADQLQGEASALQKQADVLKQKAEIFLNTAADLEALNWGNTGIEEYTRKIFDAVKTDGVPKMNALANTGFLMGLVTPG